MAYNKDITLLTEAETAHRVMRLATVANNRLRKHGTLLAFGFPALTSPPLNCKLVAASCRCLLWLFDSRTGSTI